MQIVPKGFLVLLVRALNVVRLRIAILVGYAMCRHFDAWQVVVMGVLSPTVRLPMGPMSTCLLGPAG
jgi:hypothetical protein